MASFLSRRLTTRLLRNPNTTFSRQLTATTSHLRSPPQQKPYNHHHPKSFFSTSNLTPLSSDSTTTSPCRPPPTLFPTNPSLLGFPFAHSAKHYQILNPTPTRHFSSNPPDDSGAATAEKSSVDPAGAGEFRHQEITGPTVERDVSALANETRETLERLRRSIYNLSTSLAVLGVAQLALGAWIVHAVPTNIPKEVSIQGLVAFAFPFSLAFLTRRTLKPMSFFHRMEEQGRLQILTLSLQVSKNLNLMFSRIRVVSLCCVVGISVGSLAALLMR